MAATGLRREAASSCGWARCVTKHSAAQAVDWTTVCLQHQCYLRCTGQKVLVMLFASHSPPGRKGTGSGQDGAG